VTSEKIIDGFSEYECFVKGKGIIKINEEYIPHKRGKGKLIKIRRKLKAHQPLKKWYKPLSVTYNHHKLQSQTNSFHLS
jgi:hypothetical protein